jgi:hypothetical protein
LRYNQDAFPAEDYDLWSRAIFYCKLVNIPQVLYQYRIHGVQVTKTDDRVEKKDREIRTEYLKRALPGLGEEDAICFIELTKKRKIDKQDLAELKFLIERIIHMNKNKLFFATKKLSERLYQYYQARVFTFLKNNPKKTTNFDLLLALRIRQIVKLFLK